MWTRRHGDIKRTGRSPNVTLLTHTVYGLNSKVSTTPLKPEWASACVMCIFCLPSSPQLDSPLCLYRRASISRNVRTRHSYLREKLSVTSTMSGRCPCDLAWVTTIQSLKHRTFNAHQRTFVVRVFFLPSKGQNPLHQFPRSKSVTSWLLAHNKVRNKSVT